MTPQVTTTDATGGSRYTLEPGIYHFRVVPEIEFSAGNYSRTEEETSQAGNPQIKLALMVGDGAGQVKVVERLTFTEKAAWRVSSFLKAAGVYPGAGVSLNLTAAMCIGLTGRCETENKVPNGGQYERTVVKNWLPAPEQHPERLTVAALDTPPPPTVADETPYTDEIPF